MTFSLTVAQKELRANHAPKHSNEPPPLDLNYLQSIFEGVLKGYFRHYGPT